MLNIVSAEDPFRAAAAKARSVQAEVLEVNERRARFNQVDGDRNGKLDVDEVKALLNLETETEALTVIKEVQYHFRTLRDVQRCVVTARLAL